MFRALISFVNLVIVFCGTWCLYVFFTPLAAEDSILSAGLSQYMA